MSTSDSLFEPVSVHLTITAKGGASELLLLNGAYNQVGQAIGSLSVDVAPGLYHIRQRIGDTESIDQVYIQPDDGPRTLTLKALDFPSSAPIVGTSTFLKVNAQDWKKPAALVGKPGIRVAIRSPEEMLVDAPTVAALVHLRAETARIRLETMGGKLVCEFKDCSGTGNLEESALFILDVDVCPGYYVLVQSVDDGRQLCLPLIVHPDWSPRVYLLCLRNQKVKDRDSYLPVSLDNASIIYWPSNSPEGPAQPDLIRVEAARKALARGRNLGGFSGGGTEGVIVREPMLSLLDAYLLLKDMRLSEARQAETAINAAADMLGEEFPDVIALRYAFWMALQAAHRSQGASGLKSEPPRATALLSGPPLLAHSWRYLLIWPPISDQLSEIMPSEFIPEASWTWFLWSEKKGSRGNKATEHIRLQRGVPDARAQGQHDRALRIAQAALVALMETGAVQGWVEKLVKVARRHAGEADFEKLDPLLVQLIDGLSAIQDPFLQTAFGKEELARRVLLGFNLPVDRFDDLLAMLNSTLTKEGLMRGRVPQLIRIFGAYVKGKLGIGDDMQIKG